MNENQVTKLNYYCFAEMFRQLKMMCDIENEDCTVLFVKYSKLIKFVQSFDYITNMFYHWDNMLYRDLVISHNLDYFEMVINFDYIYDGFKGFTSKQQNEYFKTLIDNINERTQLTHVTIKYTTCVMANHLDFFEGIMNALQKKGSVINLKIQLEGYTIPDLSQFHKLNVLNLIGRIDVSELVECCLSNPNLHTLSIKSNETAGRLSDIALMGGSLQYLKEFNLFMASGIDAAKYAPLARLPRLRKLTISGEHEIGSLRPLFEQLAAKQLRILVIEDAHINDEESYAISQIISLQELKCKFIETKSIGHLSHLSELKELIIKSKFKGVETIKEVVKIAFNTKKDRSLTIYFDHVSIKFKPYTLEIYFRHLNVADISEYAALSQVPDVHNLYIYTLKNIFGSLNLLKGYASIMPQTLQRLELLNRASNMLYLSEEGIVLTCDEILQISTIKSLTTIECKICDLSNIFVLGELPHLQKLIIKLPSIWDEAFECEALIRYLPDIALKMLFTAIASNSCSALTFLDISPILLDLSLTSELSKIKSLKSLKCSFSDDECIKCLDKFTELEDLEISSHHNIDSFSDVVLKMFSSIIRIKIEKSHNSDQLTYDSHSKVLRIRQKKLGALHSFLKILSAKELPNFKILHITKISINYEDSLLISQIKTLEQLTCQFSDPRSFEVVTPQIIYKKIQVHENMNFPKEVLNFLRYSNGDVIIQNEPHSIKYYKKENKLILIKEPSTKTHLDMGDYACLGKLENLQILHIMAKHENGSLKELFSNLAVSSSLTHLTIDDAINSDELLEISKITSLKKLKCAFSDSRKINTLGQLKELQEFTITTYKHGKLQEHFKEISSQSSTCLQTLIIEEPPITFDELKAIASVRSLKRLECAFTIPVDEDALPKMPHLTELCIRSHSERKLYKSLRVFLNTPLLTTLSILEYSLEKQDIAALTELKSLRKLHLNLTRTDCIDLLFPLKKLEELQIDLIGRRKLINVPITTKYPPNLSKLAIRNLKINYQHFENILQLSTLKSLECVLLISRNDDFGRLAQLEELVIKPEGDTLHILLKAFAMKYPTTLQHLVIVGQGISLKNMLQLSQFSLLATLDCSINVPECFHHISKLCNLKTLKLEYSFPFMNVSNEFLNMLMNLPKLESICFKTSEIDKMEEQILHKALEILKTVRDPIIQKPLKLSANWYLDTNLFHVSRQQFYQFLIKVKVVYE